MVRRVRWKSHARCEAGEKPEIISGAYLSLRQFTDITDLTTEIAATLIEKIIVSQAEKIDGQQRQKVRIIYNFIGDVSEDIEE